jgi:hypothetical protein
VVDGVGVVRIALISVVALLVIALLGYARGEPGADDRAPDSGGIVIVVEAG